jgi:hypothetical protein
MRLPRPQITLRGTMLVIAVVGLALSGWRYWEGHRRRTLLFRDPSSKDQCWLFLFDMRDPHAASQCRQMEVWLRASRIEYRVEYQPNDPSSTIGAYLWNDQPPAQPPPLDPSPPLPPPPPRPRAVAHEERTKCVPAKTSVSMPPAQADTIDAGSLPNLRAIE